MSSAPSLWDTKKRVEALYPDFPNIDISAPDFDLTAYLHVVHEILQEAGIPLEPFSVTWENLSCSVPVQPPQLAIATVLSGISSFVSAIRNGFASVLHPHDRPKPTPEANVLDSASGYLRPGDLTLVLGASGSGTSLLLSQVAGRSPPRLLHTSGNVLYQGEGRLAGFVRPSHFIHYIQQEDIHIPTLTVRHTLKFAAECKWPPWIPFSDIMRENDILLTARILGIERTLDTIVGSDILRGVSGGERKRVTIGEMGIGLVSGILVMDNWSKGLDAATTLSITRSMRMFTEQAHGSVLVSMQAPGAETYNIFDNLCLLNEGKVAYFGPRKDAESYLLSLGFHRPSHRSVPDFVSTIFDETLRHEYVPAIQSAPKPPETAEEFSEAFQKSEYAWKMKETIAEINQQPHAELPEGSERLVKLASRATIQSPRYQIGALIRRQVNWVSSIRRNVATDIMQDLIFGLILGSIFWQLPDTQGGAGSRAGAVFLALLFIGLSAVSKTDERFFEKKVFTKQRASSFFDAWTYLITVAIYDFIVELLKSICLFVPLYLMAGLSIGSSAQRLLYAVLIATFFSLLMISLTRFLVAAFDDNNAAQGVAGLLTILMVLFSGYLKNGSDLPGWLKWIYWADPLHYGLEALLINEFDGLTFKCAVGELLPRDGNVPEAFRLCPVSDGKSYLEDFRGITNEKEFRLYFFLVLLGYNILFFVLSAIATALSQEQGYARSSSVSDHVKSDEDVAVDVNEKKQLTSNFSFMNMNYSVESGAKVLLTDVTGNAVAGKVVLLMGESGAGKTTLLDVLAMRKTLSKGTDIAGETRLNGALLDKKTLANVSGYCEQNDLHIGEATVFEAILFSANLRLPKDVPTDEKRRRAQEVVDMLGLEPYKQVLVKVLGSGEKKLLTMALEVVTDPMVLFLDEPTSGISSSSAMIVAKALRKIADSGTSVICTVHQPSAEVFTTFDRLLLLKRGGKTVYFGDIGEYGCTMQKYFETIGAPKMKEDENPAAWMLDVIADSKIDWSAEWNRSENKVQMDEETFALAKGGDESSKIEYSERPGLGAQIIQVIHRQFWRYWRLPEYNVTRVFLLLMIAIFVGLLFLRDIDETPGGAQLAFAALFLTLIPATLSSQNVIPPTVDGRSVFYRETASGTYRSLAQNVAVGIVEVPFTFVASTIFAVVFYFLVGLDPAKFFYFFLAVQLIYYLAVMFGVMLSTLLPSAALAANIASAIMSVLMVLSGFFILKPEMPSWWGWTVWVNPFSYYLSGLIQNQMSGKTFRCTSEEFASFERPPNTTCEAISDAYTTIIVKGMERCRFCPTPDGQALIDLFGADDVNKWLSLVAILVAIFLCRVGAAYGFSRVKFLTR